MKKLISKDDLFDQNTIGVKIEKQKRVYRTAVADETITKEILRTKYLKLCWSCGTPYESYKYNTFACCHRCRQNITLRRNKDLNPLGRMDILTKEKNTRNIKDKFGYL